MNKYQLSVALVLVAILIYGYSSREIEVTYKDGSIFVKTSTFGIARESLIINKADLPKGYEMQGKYSIQFSPTRDKIAFAMNNATFGGQGGGELFTRKKLYVASISGVMREVLSYDPHAGEGSTEEVSDSWEVERWLDKSRILINRQSGFYDGLSMGTMIVNLNGTIESTTDNAHLEEDLRKLRGR